jgi:hypothetical protein
MSDATSKVPQGYKRCPKCKGIVKGPRTKSCSCGHVFVFGKTVYKRVQDKEIPTLNGSNQEYRNKVAGKILTDTIKVEWASQLIDALQNPTDTVKGLKLLADILTF